MEEQASKYSEEMVVWEGRTKTNATNKVILKGMETSGGTKRVVRGARSKEGA